MNSLLFSIVNLDGRLIGEAIGVFFVLVLLLLLVSKKSDKKSDKSKASEGLSDVPRRHTIPHFKKQDASETTALGKSFEGFEIQSFLTGGHLADLCEVVDTTVIPQRKAILTIIKAKTESIIVKKISRAVNLLSGFSHPNMVSFFGEGKGPCTGEWQQYERYGSEIYYVLSEHVRGGTLKDRLEDMENGQLPIAEAVYIAIDTLYSLEFLAYLSLVHRNIKPSNIMIDPRGVGKLTGFYLLKEVKDTTTETEALTRAGSSLGTPEYMPLEQCKDAAHIDCRSDIYSTGVILYQMLTGLSPFRGKNLNETFRNIKNLQVESVKNLRPDIPEGLSEIVMKAIERDPQNRYQHPSPFCRALESLL